MEFLWEKITFECQSFGQWKFVFELFGCWRSFWAGFCANLTIRWQTKCRQTKCLAHSAFKKTWNFWLQKNTFLSDKLFFGFDTGFEQSSFQGVFWYILRKFWTMKPPTIMGQRFFLKILAGTSLVHRREKHFTTLLYFGIIFLL